MRSVPVRVLGHVLALTLFAGWPRTSAAQVGRAELTGQVRDEAGAVVPECRVTVTEVATNVAVVVSTGPKGVFNLPYLRPGFYRIAAEASGFRPSVREGVQLATGERVRIDLTLTVGPFTEATTVTADASLLQTESSSLGEVIGNRSVMQLPLNGRSYLPLVALVPGWRFLRELRSRASTGGGRASTSTSMTVSPSCNRSPARSRTSRSSTRSRSSRSSPTHRRRSSGGSTAG